jgi:ADP-ribosyl-[dinitrogen reductase] hydrolase
MENDQNRYQGCLLGLAVGDAVGTTVEFMPRGSFPIVTDMLGGGPFNLYPGQWTDDTSMALCLAHSLLEKNGHDPLDQMQRYMRWCREGYMSSTGKCFDIGRTVLEALGNFEKTGNPISGPTRGKSAGNGSLMRLAPVPMFYAPDMERAMFFSGESSRTTHGATEAVEACRLFGGMVVKALAGKDKKHILLESDIRQNITATSILEISRGDYISKQVDQILSTGYVVESLSAALWAFWHSNSFEEAILCAVNLGNDSDTTAAICGQIAGAYYGRTGIPLEWQAKLFKRDEILALADQLSAPRATE